MKVTAYILPDNSIVEPFLYLAIISFLGFMFSLAFEDPTMLARFGSVAVCYGIYLTFKDLAKEYNKIKDFVSDKVVEDYRFLDWLSKEINKAKSIDAIVLAYGTLLWGWGDLLMISIM